MSINDRPRAARVGRRNVIVRLAALSAAAGFLSASSAHAADVLWNVSAGNWTDPLSWSPNTVPTVADRAILDLATPATATVNSDVAEDPLSISIRSGNTLRIESGGVLATGIDPGDTVDDVLDTIRIGDGSAGTALVLDGGTLRNEISASVNSTDDIYVGVGAGGSGTLTQSGATSLVSARDIRVGADGGTGTYSLTDGTAQVNALIVGRQLGGNGTFILDGGSVLATYGTNSTFWVGQGYSSTGTVHIIDGLIQTTGDVNIGYQDGIQNGTGVVTHDAGTITDGGSFFLGRGSARDATPTTYRGNGTYTLGVNASSTATINVNAAPTTPAVTDDPVPPGGLYVGYNGGIGNLTINGGAVNVVADLGVGYETRAAPPDLPNGTINQHGGNVTVGRDVYVGYRRGSDGAYNLDGAAQLNVTGTVYLGSNNNKNNAANGGTEGTMTVGGNAVLNVTENLRLGVTGGIGTLTQTGGDINVTGRVRVGQLGRDGNRGRGTINISGGTFDVGDNFWMGDSGAGDGWFNLSGTGVVTITNSLVVGRVSNGTVIFNQTGGTLSAASVSIQSSGADSAGEYNLSGGVLNTGNLTNNKTFNYTGGAANIGGAILGTGTTTVAAGLDLAADSVTQGAVNVDGKITVRPDSTAAGVSRIGTITLGAAGKLDLSDNKLITPAPLGTWDGSAYTDISGLVDVGRGNASNAQWDGARGIVTTDTRAVNANDLVSIGTASAAQVKGITGTDTALFAGQTVTATDTIAMVTWGGDATLDGKINIDDYGRIDFNVGSSGSVFGWYNGDFNYDGKINIDDYGIIDFNVTAQNLVFPTAGASGGGIDGVAAVPEPAGLSLLALGATALVRRRRRES